ncbi:MAG: ATP-dependent RNA helicase [Bacteroidetes bacterium GWE2_41_25]|nr:MAG: ATP-dependent RNA helicase [Bacteroidetes bacterium GWA2_40_15]OFX96837.1 MAG: ATP-dependent RNA helicase [Bacteroidetes bacterium GWE2_41_25]OFY00035.1 MAG: ATP-dependent RNA helicase [Bacteroidetes bacterium GWC2_40_22]OFY57297.1 MAG: ATP-dependent RNA helicase [Bacteroidetes bacterium GWF2_41_9]HBH83912.1 ATP-dependent RNA helicase [Bacteroidales bacterium]
MLFDDLELNPEILESIDYMGFRETTPIQEMAIPVILSGNDLIACAQTGTGKTAAFLLPIMNYISEKRPSHTHTLILVPTRELALQIDQQIQGLAYTLNITSIAVYGGGDGSGWDQEKSALSRGADIIVATPGRLISHLNQGYVKFNQIEVLVLDEADRMLDIGFYDDIMRIISHVPKKRQTLMFSATMPPKIRSMSKHIMKNPVEIALEMSKPTEGVIQAVYMLSDHQKLPLINSLIADNPEYHSILIFSSTKKKVSEIVRGLRSKAYQVEGISSDLEQKEREDMLLRFRTRKTRVLVATDILSRGIDIKDINLVINFDAPSDGEDYVHRVGRTARAETTGVAVTLINKTDLHKMQRIEKLIGYKVYVAPLPDFIAEKGDDGHGYHASSLKPDKGTFRRRYNNKGRSRGPKH